MSYPVVRHYLTPLPDVSEHVLSFPFKFTAFKTEQLQTFLTVFSNHLYIHLYGHTVLHKLVPMPAGPMCMQMATYT